VAHAFAATGSDLRLRIRLPAAPNARMVQTIHDLTLDYTYTPPNTAPSTPALALPLGGASTSDTTPDLSATFSDPETGDTGTLEFEVCTIAIAAAQTCAGAGGTLLASGSSPSGVAINADGLWTVSPALIPRIVHWHARAIDNGNLTSAWSASRQLTISESITLSVGSATVPLGLVLAGTDATASTIASVASNDPQGYTLSATDENDTWGTDCACGTIPDWTGTGPIPTAWDAGISGANGWFGATVRDTTGASDNRLAKWGTVNAAGWPASDYTNNFYAGLKQTTSSTLHTVTTAAPADTIAITWRTTPSAATPGGSYGATITLTATGNL